MRVKDFFDDFVGQSPPLHRCSWKVCLPGGLRQEECQICELTRSQFYFLPPSGLALKAKNPTVQPLWLEWHCWFSDTSGFDSTFWFWYCYVILFNFLKKTWVVEEIFAKVVKNIAETKEIILGNLILCV